MPNTKSRKNRKKLEKAISTLSIPRKERKCGRSNRMLVMDILDGYDFHIHRANSSDYPDYDPPSIQRLVEICPPKDWLMTVVTNDKKFRLGIHKACACASVETVLFLAKEMPKSFGRDSEFDEGHQESPDGLFKCYAFDICQRYRSWGFPTFSFDDLKKLLRLFVPVSPEALNYALENGYPNDLLQLMTENFPPPPPSCGCILDVTHGNYPEHLEVLVDAGIQSKIEISHTDKIGSESFISLMNILAEKDKFVGQHLLLSMSPDLDNFDDQQKQQMVGAFQRMLHKSPTIVAMGCLSSHSPYNVGGPWLEAITSLATSAEGNSLVDLLLEARAGAMSIYETGGVARGTWTIAYGMLRKAPGNWCHCLAAKSEQKRNLGVARKHRLANARKHRKKKKHLAELFARLLTPRNERMCDRSDDTLVQTILNICRKDPQLTLERCDAPVLTFGNITRFSPLFTAMHYFLYKNVDTSCIREFLLAICPDKEQIMTEYHEDGVENGLLPMHIACWKAREETMLFLAKEMPFLLTQKFKEDDGYAPLHPFHFYQHGHSRRYRIRRDNNICFVTMKKLLELEPVPIRHHSLQSALEDDYPADLLKIMTKLMAKNCQIPARPS